MSDQKTVKVIVGNLTAGPKVLNSIPPGILAAGDSTDEPVLFTEGEFAAAKATGWFSFDGDEAGEPEPGPLDQSVEKLTAYLETVADADEVQKLIDAETAGKSRSGAITALEARKDAILAA